MEHNDHALRRRTFLAAAAASCAAPALAQSWPTRPVTIVTHSAPGGSSDTALRALAEGLKDRLGQPVTVENRPGANSTIAAHHVAKAAPDGYTLLFMGMGSSHPLFSRVNPIDLSQTMTPVSNAYRAPNLVYVRASLPAQSLTQLMAYAPGKDLKVGVAAASTELFLAALKQRLGASFPFRPIPYRSDVAVVQALVAGDVDFSSSAPAAYLGQVKAGKIRPVLVTSPERTPLFPAVPSSEEQGLSGLHIAYSIGVWAPAGTPANVVNRLNEHIRAVVRAPEYGQRMAAIGCEAVSSSPEGQMRMFQQELKFWSDAARLTGFQPR